MKILINGLQIGKFNSGVQYYAKLLYGAIKENEHSNIETQLYQVDSNSHFPFSILRSQAYIRIVRIFNENFYLPRYLLHNRFDVYHSPNYLLPCFIKSPSIVFVHDLITFDYPELCQWESVLYFRLFLPYSIKKAYKLITGSETVKWDIITRFKIPADKITVVPLGISKIFKRTINSIIISQYGISPKYILFVGNIEPKKNLVRLIKAYNRLLNTNQITHQLVIAGKKAWNYKNVFQTVQILKLRDKVIFTGYIPENELPVLYSMAALFVFPSIYEGFGIPPLEAMACETPVLASNAGALPETTGGNCLFVDPYDVEDIADGMRRLISNKNLREEYIEKGIKWVKQFTWEKAAEMTMAIYEELGKENQETGGRE